MIERRIEMSAKMEISHCCNARRSRGRVGGASSRRRRRHRRVDFAVEGIQDAGRELSDLFRRLRRRRNAERLVAAIRHRDVCAIKHLLGCHCKVEFFFCRPGYECVKICCSFNRGAATVSFDICVRRLFDERQQCCF